MDTLLRNEIKNKMRENPRFFKSILSEYDISNWIHLSNNLNEIAYMIVNNIYEKPSCACGKELSFRKYSIGYSKTCGDIICVNLDIKNKREATCLSKYGETSFFRTKEFNDKTKETTLEKYGVEHPTQTEWVQDKIKKTNLEKYGVEHASKSNWFQDKIKKTNLEKYGVEHVSQSDWFQENVKETRKNPKHNISSFKKKLKYCEDSIEFISEDTNEIEIKCNSCNSVRLINKCTINFRIKNKEVICTKCNPIFNKISKNELELLNYIKNIYDGEIIPNFRKNGFEIDVYLPELNLGFEFNGIYYHSDKFVDKRKHYNKSMFFKEHGIKLMHVWEDDWKLKQTIVKSIIKSKIKPTVIGGRSCFIKIVDSKISKKFHEEHHLDGYASSSIHIGLFYNDLLVGLASFGKPRFNKKIDVELVRYTVSSDYLIIGGFNKLFNFFKNNYEFSTLQTFKKIDMGTSNIYENLGFEKLNDVFSYFYNIDGIRMHRWNFTKKKLGIFGKKITEREYMESKGFYRVWDSGSNVFIYTKK